jgi:SAM-dependent methyltransferase
MEATIAVAAEPQARSRTIVLFFAPAIFCSAFLLFWCQPMVGKMLLPLLGGAASVWITCLLFFQLMLLAGYGYAHLLERYAGVRRQMQLHSILMLSAALLLPVDFGSRPDAWASEHPSLWLLATLIQSVGIPFGVLSATAPLLQNWIAKTGTASGRDPYFLYAVSNAGSLLALLAYPLWIEPRWGVRVQSSGWFAGYTVLLLLVMAAVAVFRSHMQPSPSAAARATPPRTALRWKDRMFWLAAAFVPSGLMLAVTNHMLLNLASAPFLWVIPLAVYLITFMIAFARRFRISIRVLSMLAAIVLVAMFPLVAVSRPFGSRTLWYVLGAHVLLLFAGALLCHTALVARRPDAGRLTEFYFWLAAGGAAGGLFVAVLAPFVFSSVIEYPLLVGAIALFRETREERLNWGDWIYPILVASLTLGVWHLFTWGTVDILKDLKTSLSFNAVLALIAFLAQRRRIRFALTLAVLIAGYRLALPGFFDDYQTLHVSRDFFGIKKVVFDLDSNSRKLLHGDTLHGLESMDPVRSGQPLSYYHETGPVGDVMKLISFRPDQRVGVVGLGSGSMAGWANPYRRMTFFDIDPQMHDIAFGFFTYLRRCAGDCSVVIGDGRLSIEKTPDGEFDVLMLDAFNSDSIPAHLVSREAVQIYLRKLKPDGLILFHVSNRYMDVESLVTAVALDAGLHAIVRYDSDEGLPGKTSSDYVLTARRPEDFGQLSETWDTIAQPAAIQPWTDDYSNMTAIIRWP